MKNLYGITFDNEFEVLLAKSKKDALNKLANKVSKEFYKFVDNLKTTDSLLELFYKDYDGNDLIDLETQNYTENIIQMREGDRKQYIYNCIKYNCKKFFKTKPRFAREYLKEIKKIDIDTLGTGMHEVVFSKKFYIETFKLYVEKFENFKIEKINSFNEAFTRSLNTYIINATKESETKSLV
ncbi:hypothetical protein [Haloplasma contractile]|uniref:Uncharacterized protein n=1 Tax=Haloplasma contractile SSD-17B TaxID=1033810 RepID=U2EB18_9MOLU|nr:hypothetical protein [Haloplasma contractile]ERJ12298.1 hypothetical protein HLPCO_001825 [Haloplasma contractile SSD-17B]